MQRGSQEPLTTGDTGEHGGLRAYRQPTTLENRDEILLAEGFPRDLCVPCGPCSSRMQQVWHPDDAAVTARPNRARMEINEVSGAVVRAAMKVHSALGPGLLESVYRACLAHELRKMGLTVDVEWPLPILYDGVRLDVGHRIDLRVQEAVIVETKSVARFASVHEAQLLSYLKMSGLRVGLLINFNVVRLRTGIRRMVN